LLAVFDDVDFINNTISDEPMRQFDSGGMFQDIVTHCDGKSFKVIYGTNRKDGEEDSYEISRQKSKDLRIVLKEYIYLLYTKDIYEKYTNNIIENIYRDTIK